MEAMSEDIQEMTWDYLRRSYFPQFMAGIMRLEWPERFLILQELYNSDESDPPWEIRSNDPMIDMMTWIGEKGADAYFQFFIKGTTVNEDGSFTIHPNISRCLGRFGIGTDELQ